jgi:hypothetical protein
MQLPSGTAASPAGTAYTAVVQALIEPALSRSTPRSRTSAKYVARWIAQYGALKDRDEPVN